MFYGDDVPPEFLPRPDDDLDEQLRKLRRYTEIVCRRCGTPHPETQR